MVGLRWPPGWQDEAIAAVSPYVDSDDRLEINVGDPGVSIDGTLLAGFVFTGENGMPQIIHDRSGRWDVYPGPLLDGPVLRVDLLGPGQRRQVLFAHPDWEPRRR